ncbi:glycosyltransferase family 4 protein [Clostridium perfringens]|uniref:glycosyltransferase family 4 protein n=1 Tax=Clostridium perfringens TaxID=1502 RepID=UPI002A5B9E98|nr:glycosyltransferase family 4 protein [Clostridium perfringens]MDJ8932654.1 glycosyltransferase family 4 protein [Clostridium perfringens]MDJ8938522.1 glycosyltransferase family 4 protein [Clostridium perfringens]MDJ8941495.1 glycosyltransferase family 4 protein [Clostridium perfringens]
MGEFKKPLNRKKPVIALITNHDDDVYCFRKELIEGIIESGYDILISCPNGEKLKLMEDIKFIHDDAFIDRRGTNPFSDFRLLIHYRKMMSKYKPDMVLNYTVKPNIYASLAAGSLGIPYINNVTGLGSVLSMGKLMKGFVLTLFKIAFRKSTCIFFQNEENMKLAIKQGLVYGDCQLIPGSGVNTERFPLQNYPNGGNGINGEKIIFNYIGRVLHDKGVDDYIEAAKRIKKDYPNTEFNIIGFIEPTESHYEKELERLKEDNIVIYRGQQKDVKPFIERAHAIIHPSTYGEGMSNVLLENASSGRFIITTDNPGCKETLVDGSTGFIYSGGSVAELVLKIEEFLAMDNEQRREMGIKGRAYVEKNFSREIVKNAYIERIRRKINA